MFTGDGLYVKQMALNTGDRFFIQAMVYMSLNL